jgi:hypothetical protein
MAILLGRPGRVVDRGVGLTIVVGMLHRARVLVAGHITLWLVVEGMRGSPLASARVGRCRCERTAVRLSCNVMAGGCVCVRGLHHRHRHMVPGSAIGQMLLVRRGRSWVEVCSGNGIDSSPFVGARATADAGGAVVRGWRMGRHGIRQKRCWSRSSAGGGRSCRTELQNSPRQGQK